MRKVCLNIGMAVTLLTCFTCVSPHIFAAEGEITCKGKIVDAQGDAIPDAHVFLYEMSYDMTTFDIQRTLVQQTTSDAAGDFTLSSGRSASELQRWATVLVAKKGMGIRWSSWDLRNTKTMTIRLGESGKLSGQVIDEDGQPAAHASVRALLMLPAETNTHEINYFDRLTQKTDETGRFTFDFIPLDATAEFYIEAGEEKNYCTAKQGIAGDVLSYACDQQNLRIELSDSLAMENSQRSISYGAMLANSRFLQIASRHFDDLDAPEVSPVNVKTQSISGMMIEEPFIPLSDVTIAVYDVLKDEKQPFGFVVNPVGETQTDASGRYVFERTDYDPKIDHSFLVAYHKDYSLGVRPFLFLESGLEPLTLEMGHKEYSGRVVDSSGNPIVGARVSVYVSDFMELHDYYPLEKEAAQANYLTAVTNAEGEFILSNMPLFARAEFSIKAEGYCAQYTWPTDRPLEAMTVPAGGKPLLFGLEKMGALRGLLVEETTNAGISDEKIFIVKVDGDTHVGAVWSVVSGSHVVRDLEGNNREVVTDSQGMFTVEDLSPGSYKISLDPFVSEQRKWYAAAQKINVSEGQTAEVTISANQSGTMTILVQDSEGQPLDGANVVLKSLTEQKEAPVEAEKRQTVYPLTRVTFVPAVSSESQTLFQAANPSGGTILPVRTKGDGRAVFRLAPGDYAIESVRKTDYEYLPDVQGITVESGKNYDMVVNMKHMPGFYGRCIDSTGQPVSGVQIRQFSFPDMISISDREGTFRFDRETIKRITAAQTKSLKDDTADLEWKDRYQNRMVLQEIIFLGMCPETQKGGWFKYNWEKRFDLELKPTIQATGKIVDSQGQPVPSNVIVYAFPNKVRWMSYDYIFREKDFYFYEDAEVAEDGTFSLQLLPEFSYILEAVAEGYGKKQEIIISSKYDRQISGMLREGNDFVVEKETIHDGNRITEKEHLTWILSEKKEHIDFGEILLPSQNLTLSGVVVDRMGNPLKGYHISISGDGQFNVDPAIVTDASGHFSITGLCEGEVDIYAKNGEYTVQQRGVKVGRDDLRIVSPDHPASQKAVETRTDDSLCDVEIILVNQDTQEQIHYEKASVKMTPKNGDSFKLKPDEEGRYRTRLGEGVYEIDVNAYPAYHYVNAVEARVRPDVENNISIPLKKEPIIEGIIHLPESVSVDEIDVDIQPEALLSIFEGDWEIAGDGQFLCKLSLSEFKGQMATHGWLWICTKDKKYVSRTKFSLNDSWVDITLVPGATVKFERSKQHSSIFTWGWDQEEYNNYHTWSTGRGPTKDVLVQDEAFMGIQGLVPGQEDLTYKFMVAGIYKKLKVNSGDLEPGQTKIIELPSSER